MRKIILSIPILTWKKNKIKPFVLSLIFFFVAPLISFTQGDALLQLKYENNYTPTYPEVIEMYQLLDNYYPNAKLTQQGETDCGKPLHLFIINNKEEFNPLAIKEENKSVLLINNGIHPGEPAGIDASLKFADDILRNKNGMAKILKNTVIIIIPVYNIGGHLNRSAYNRSGQTTPYETGFRGNAKNLDLNRDFTKCDSENAISFTKIFQAWDPDVFLDTHTTNGSEHQYSVTLIAPSPDMFPPSMENFLRKKFIPSLYEKMEKGEYKLTPYVSWMHRDPKMGIKQTQESPRYSSGYASLFNTYGMMTENHVYKIYADRVKSCYQFIQTLTSFTSENSKKIIVSRKKGILESMEAKEHPITFELDTTAFRYINFKGYEVDEKQISPLTGLQRFGYNLSKPYEKKVKFYYSYNPAEIITIPEYYILPQAYKKATNLLDLNKIEYHTLVKEKTFEVEVEYIDDYSNPLKPYNGHFFHDNVKTHTEIQTIQYFTGDLIIPTRQKNIKYIIEMLDPKARDSFFRWNFFDNILDTREYFSSYGFEGNAIKYLDKHPDFNKKFQLKRENDSLFANNHRTQLAYIYNNSEWAEKSFKRFPISKIYKTFSEKKLNKFTK